jgi:hypothetical protein
MASVTAGAGEVRLSLKTRTRRRDGQKGFPRDTSTVILEDISNGFIYPKTYVFAVTWSARFLEDSAIVGVVIKRQSPKIAIRSLD